jgi:hypothetical protein
MRPFDHHGYVPVQGLRVFHARLHLHWSAIALAAFLLIRMIGQPAQALVVVAGYFGVILLHEIGHAAMARRLGYRAPEIRLSFIHGECEIDGPDSRRDEIFIAWGGVLVQLAVAVPLVALEQIRAVMALPFANIVIGAFGNFSLLLVLLNLMPLRGLDGAKAWGIVPLLWRGCACAAPPGRPRATCCDACAEALHRSGRGDFAAGASAAGVLI